VRVRVCGVAGVARQPELLTRCNRSAFHQQGRGKRPGLKVGILHQDIAVPIQKRFPETGSGVGLGNCSLPFESAVIVLVGSLSTQFSTFPFATARTGFPQMGDASANAGAATPADRRCLVNKV
jgi:hypothetical protein